MGVAVVNRLFRVSLIGMLKFEKIFWKAKNYPARLPESNWVGGGKEVSRRTFLLD